MRTAEEIKTMLEKRLVDLDDYMKTSGWDNLLYAKRVEIVETLQFINEED